jgi:blue copper oxidase
MELALEIIMMNYQIKNMPMNLKMLSILVFICADIPIALSQNLLKIPDTLSGDHISLRLAKGSNEFFEGFTTETMGANGNILGPTIILQNGRQVTMHVENKLEEPTTLHWHGLHVSPENDGGPHTPIAPGNTWSPSFQVKDKASTYWYHPHLHHKTNEHVSKGISGLIIVRDDEEGALKLPRNYGKDDIPLIIQTKDFDEQKQIIVHSNNDDVPMINGTINPFIQLPAQLVRLRILNGASQRAFMLGFSNNQTFYQIGSDGGLLNKPVALQRLLISTGERAEILIDLSGKSGQTLYLMSFASELPNGIYGASNPGMSPMMELHGYKPNPLNGTTFQLLKIDVTAALPNAVFDIPQKLSDDTPISVNNSQFTRQFLFSPEAMGLNQLNGNFLINGRSFDMDRIDFTIPVNQTEIWEVRNQSAISHPFHIHDVQFYLLSRNGILPPENERGRKDVVFIRPGETIRLITKFQDYISEHVPYMYHCHLLTHEDGGMMGQFLVTEASAIQDAGDRKDSYISCFPNPFTNHIRFQSPFPYSGQLIITDIRGKICLIRTNFCTDEILSTDTLSQGIYQITFTHDTGHFDTILVKILP